MTEQNGASGCPQSDDRASGRPPAPHETERLRQFGVRASHLLAQALGSKYLAALHPIAPVPVTAREGMTVHEISGDGDAEHLVQMVRGLAERLRGDPVERFYEIPVSPVGQEVRVKSTVTGVVLNLVAVDCLLRLSVCCQRRRLPARVISGRELLAT